MNKVNPQISQDFLNEIKNQTSEVLEVEGLKIKTCKGVFPPRSVFSHSSEKLHTVFGNLKNLDVLDMGTGTGVQAIQAVKDGAESVVAVDINPQAVLCAQENCRLNNVSDKVRVFESDLFSQISDQNVFDVIIANLPITDFPIEGIVEATLYDPDYKIHKQFLTDAPRYLKKGGVIIMTHINFKGDHDFQDFEKMLADYHFKPERFIEIDAAGYKWRMYRILAQ